MCCLYTLCTANCVNFRQFSCILTIAFDGACSCIYINSNYFSYKKKPETFRSRAEQQNKKKIRDNNSNNNENCGRWLVLFVLLCECVCICLFFFCLFTLDIFFLHLLCFSSYLRMSIFFRYVSDSKIALSRIFSYIFML